MAELSSIATFTWPAGVVKVTGISGGGVGREMLEVTEIDDTSPDFIAGLIDSGEITLELQLDPDDAVHTALIADCLTGISRAWSLALAGTGTKTFAGNGKCRSVSPAVRAKGIVTATAVIRTTGPTTYS